MSKEAAFIFPGQGSQYEGMGRNLLEHQNLEVQRIAGLTYKEGRRFSGIDLRSLCLTGSSDALSSTRLTQPAILVTSVTALRILEDVTHRSPAVVAGHSLGEFSALVAAQSLTFEQAVRIVTKRGQYMEEAGKRNPGSMAALIGVDLKDVGRICSQAEVQIANYNIGQTVISGTRENVLIASEMAREMHGKVFPLPVSIASHSSLMVEAEEKLQLYINGEVVADPQVPVILNTTGRYAIDSDDILEEIPRQLTSSVLWVQTIGQMIEDGVDAFTEVGPGQILSKMLKRGVFTIPEDSIDNSDDIISKLQ